MQRSVFLSQFARLICARRASKGAMRFFLVPLGALAIALPASAQTTGVPATVRPPVEVLSRRPVNPAPIISNNGTASQTYQAPVPTELSASALNQTLSQAEQTQNADALLLAYGQAVTDPVLARLAIGQLLSNYYSLRNQATTAEQATQAVSEASLRFQVLQSAQNQVLIQQNQQLLQQNARILALLEAGLNRR